MSTRLTLNGLIDFGEGSNGKIFSTTINTNSVLWNLSKASNKYIINNNSAGAITITLPVIGTSTNQAKIGHSIFIYNNSAGTANILNINNSIGGLVVSIERNNGALLFAINNTPTWVTFLSTSTILSKYIGSNDQIVRVSGGVASYQNQIVNSNFPTNSQIQNLNLLGSLSLNSVTPATNEGIRFNGSVLQWTPRFSLDERTNSQVRTFTQQGVATQFNADASVVTLGNIGFSYSAGIYTNTSGLTLTCRMIGVFTNSNNSLFTLELRINSSTVLTSQQGTRHATINTARSIQNGQTIGFFITKGTVTDVSIPINSGIVSLERLN